MTTTEIIRHLFPENIDEAVLAEIKAVYGLDEEVDGHACSCGVSWSLKRKPTKPCSLAMITKICDWSRNGGPSTMMVLSTTYRCAGESNGWILSSSCLVALATWNCADFYLPLLRDVTQPHTEIRLAKSKGEISHE